MIEPLVAFEKLAALESADEIADFLSHQGVKGDLGDTETCVLAVYFHKLTEADYVGVTEDEVVVGFVQDPSHSFGCTPAMASFVANFDDGCYPYLIDGYYE